MNQLKPAALRHLPNGSHGDGNNLYLQVKNQSRTWIYRFKLGGKRPELSLGAFPATSLADARGYALELAKLIAKGVDPKSARDSLLNRVSEPKTLRECSASYIKMRGPEWTNAKHANQWQNTLDTYVHGRIGQIPVHQITTQHIYDCLEPIWITKTETATRVRQRVERVLAWAKKQGYREGDNPATWKDNLDLHLASPTKIHKVEHFPSLPWQHVPLFISDIRARRGVICRAMEFLILTASRFEMVQGAKWSEFDLDAMVWTVPASRTKRDVLHEVPLTQRCVELLEAQRAVRVSDYVFNGQKTGKPVATFKPAITKSKTKWCDPQGRPITTHGFRSSFRVWVAEQTQFSGELAEHQLHHVVGSKVEQSYQRSTLVEKRRALMAEWEAYLTV